MFFALSKLFLLSGTTPSDISLFPADEQMSLNFFFFLLFQISPGTILLPFSELLSETSCIALSFGVDELQLFCDIQNLVRKSQQKTALNIQHKMI